MKAFLTKVLLYAILLTAGAFSLNYILEKGFKKSEEGEYQTWNAIRSSKMSSDVIISGSSRAWVQISPEILDSVLHIDSYNLGIEGYYFSMQYVRFKLFEKYNKKPRLIIQNVDFISTFYRREDSFNKTQFFPYLHEDLIKDELKTIFSKSELYIPAMQYHSEYLTILHGLSECFNWKHYLSENYKGYCGQERTWDGSLLEAILSKDSIVINKKLEIVELFDTYLNYCKGNDIQVILVFTPQYIKATEFTKNWDKEMQVYHDFSKKYDIPFLDYSHDPICYDTTYFYNAMHLNKKGAELFSLKLANDIKEQNLYKKP
ncbi:MAG: hypothetical protein EZS26_002212 [Candidatus Ordinivivax streblomastigis]|uniref:SGNH/GDSL hydrolase family protein n=1 Tax=Candidatus Ordinivivax streblomastigis TaxID=2540710 RepID=A0A5M8NZR0_9BACT|nr:MAG: hypothetical protein EZS26_002212 [Candidatus Ordinivivax streblomastigis]